MSQQLVSYRKLIQQKEQQILNLQDHINTLIQELEELKKPTKKAPTKK